MADRTRASRGMVARIARFARVHRITARRVLNGLLPTRPTTRARVLAVLDQLHAEALVPKPGGRPDRQTILAIVAASAVVATAVAVSCASCRSWFAAVAAPSAKW